MSLQSQLSNKKAQVKTARMAPTDFDDQLNASGASFSALTSSSFPSLTDFNAGTTSEALKWTDL